MAIVEYNLLQTSLVPLMVSGYTTHVEGPNNVAVEAEQIQYPVEHIESESPPVDRRNNTCRRTRQAT